VLPRPPTAATSALGTFCCTHEPKKEQFSCCQIESTYWQTVNTQSLAPHEYHKAEYWASQHKVRHNLVRAAHKVLDHHLHHEQ
jgi:hypothetical protein